VFKHILVPLERLQAFESSSASRSSLSPGFLRLGDADTRYEKDAPSEIHKDRI